MANAEMQDGGGFKINKNEVSPGSSSRIDRYGQGTALDTRDTPGISVTDVPEKSNGKFSAPGIDSEGAMFSRKITTFEDLRKEKRLDELKSGGRYVVAIVTVEQRKNSVNNIDYVDVTHAISGRLEKESSRRSSTREPDFKMPATPAAYISICRLP